MEMAREERGEAAVEGQAWTKQWFDPRCCLGEQFCSRSCLGGAVKVTDTKLSSAAYPGPCQGTGVAASVSS